MSLFDYHAKRTIATQAPLAARMRPRNLDEYVGQDHILGVGRLLRRAIEADQLSSVIFHGPPGTGKTTLARIIANTTQAHFTAINAVLAGVKAIREAVESAQARLGQHGLRTILFVDEVHRFNKSQQDALLPWVENGTLTLIGATTENPFFEVNPALVSRSRVFQLLPLSDRDLRLIAYQALSDAERGLGQRQVRVDDDALEHLISVASGDARGLLNTLELAAATTPENEAGEVLIDLPAAEESIQQRAVLYDKEGDAHFDTISAFIKSVRGSDPDAALYWLARMVYAGEDPRFIFRRLIILASEDIGLAKPEAISVVLSCAQAFERIGLPEGRYPLAHATIYLATCPKSNSTMGFFDALEAVKAEAADVPDHLRDPSRDGVAMGHGVGYLYPHAYRDHWVAQQYLPDSLQGRLFYQPSTQGEEGKIAEEVERRREAQLAASFEAEQGRGPRLLSYGQDTKATERWLHRTLSQAGAHLATVRERIFDALNLARHHRLLDLLPGSGLLLWEATRACPEGGVYGRAESPRNLSFLQQRAASLPELRRPLLAHFELNDSLDGIAREWPGLALDRIVGRNLFAGQVPDPQLLYTLTQALAEEGQLLIHELVPSATQRVVDLLSPSQVDPELLQRWRAAEEALYGGATPSPLNWRVDGLVKALEDMPLRVRFQSFEDRKAVHIGAPLLSRWFTPREGSSYGEQLAAQGLEEDDLARIQALLRRELLNQQSNWSSTSLMLWLSPASEPEA